MENLQTMVCCIILSNVIPEWILPIITIATTFFFFYFLVFRKPNNQSWVIRPPFATKEKMHPLV
jgi:type II secretory pathway component PulF